MTRGLYKTYEGDIDGHKRNTDFETIVAHDLDFKNILFCFICLGVGVVLSMAIATMEYMIKGPRDRSKTPPIQHHTEEDFGEESTRTRVHGWGSVDLI